MNTKHIFVSVLDIEEQLPFTVKKGKTLQETMKQQDIAKKELLLFISLLEKNFKEEISYLGVDVIGEKAYERFMFKGSGFFEVMVEAPIALMAHFPEKKRAIVFCKALKTTLKKTLPENPSKEIFLDSIEVKDETDSSLTIDVWHKIKDIRF